MKDKRADFVVGSLGGHILAIGGLGKFLWDSGEGGPNREESPLAGILPPQPLQRCQGFVELFTHKSCKLYLPGPALRVSPSASASTGV